MKAFLILSNLILVFVCTYLYIFPGFVTLSPDLITEDEFTPDPISPAVEAQLSPDLIIEDEFTPDPISPAIEAKVKTIFTFLTKNNDIGKKPILKAVVHIGPYKTGSTSLQQDILKNEAALLKDGFVIPQQRHVEGLFKNHKKVANLGHFLGGNTIHSAHSNDSILTRFANFFIESIHDNRNIILSSETFCRVDPMLMDMIFNTVFDTRIVLVYRRFYEFAYSYYNEIEKKNSTFHSFHQWAHGHLSNVVYDASVSTWKRYSKYFDDIAIINFHDREKPIQVEFFCDINPELHNTCQQVKKKTRTRSNPSQNLQLKYLINAAVEKNILDLGKSNKEKILKAEGEINRFMREDLNIEWKDLPSECPEDIWEVLFQQTLKNEIEIVPAWFEERGGEEALRKDFEIFKENKSCNINIDEILEDEKWVEFFGNLVI